MIALTSIVILGAIIFIIRTGTGNDRPTVPNQAFYTTDDGKTFFADDNMLAPPFDHGGKTAVKAQVYQCGQTKFVGYLIRYTLEAKKQLEAANGVGLGAIRAAGTEIKVPLTGDTGWVNSNDKAAGKIYAVHCPDGSSDTPELVLP